MSDTEKRTALFVARGRSLDIVKEHLADHERFAAALTVLIRELGATQAYGGSYGVRSFDFPKGKVPTGMKLYSRETSYRPDKRTPEGRALIVKIAQVNALSPYQKTGSLVDKFWPGHEYPLGLIPSHYDAEGRLVSVGVSVDKLPQLDGDEIDYILDVPFPQGKDEAPVPPDAIPLLVSEYWARKERADAQKASLKKTMDAATTSSVAPATVLA
jgi:hypothetical protein